MRKTWIFKIFLLIVFFASWHSAQAVSNDLLGNVVIEINPAYPKPESRALASVNTYSVDLDRTDITWLVNGSVVKQGVGEKSIGFNMGKAHTSTKIEVRVSSKSLGVLSDSITLTPGEVDLLWESDTYVPTLYKAKPLHSSESKITVLAIPNIRIGGNKIPAKDLIYTWKIDGDPMVAQSGVGKNSFSYIGPKIFGDDIVEVVVSTDNSSVYASNRVTVTTTDPEIIFYQEDDLYGTNYKRRIAQSINMQTEEFKLRAEPFYFSTSNLEPPQTTYDWTFNGEKVTLNSDPRLLTLRHSGGSGSTNINLAIKNTKKSLQEASAAFSVYFGNNI